MHYDFLDIKVEKRFVLILLSPLREHFVVL